ncbi:MAG: zinc-binding dehydrogenase [Oscillospiraceae bacterium]|nr:zinc-binding dehydrogenase [Oscillospiraceae bacterium]
MANTVKAAVLTAPRTIELQEFPYPALPKGGAIIRTELSGICGTDKHTFKGEIRQYAGTAQEITTPFPIIQGHENVGIIEEITEEGKRKLEFDGEELHVGDRVVMCPDTVCGECWFCKHIPDYPWCNEIRSYGNSFSCKNPPHLFGGFSQYMAIIDRVKLYKVPEGMKPEVAVFAELFDVTYSLDKAKELYAFDGEGFAFGDTVVILGAGPLGIMHLIKARMLGADQVIMTDTSPFRLAFAKQFGADLTLCLADTTLEERVDLVRQRTGGRGADVVVECAGEPEAFPEGLQMVRKAGTYLIVGNFVDVGRTVELKPHEICSKNVRIMGMSNHSISGYRPSLRMMQRYQDQFPFDKLITHRFGLAEAEKALYTAMDYSASMKVVFDPWKK